MSDLQADRSRRAALDCGRRSLGSVLRPLLSARYDEERDAPSGRDALDTYTAAIQLRDGGKDPAGQRRANDSRNVRRPAPGIHEGGFDQPGYHAPLIVE